MEDARGGSESGGETRDANVATDGTTDGPTAESSDGGHMEASSEEPVELDRDAEPAQTTSVATTDTECVPGGSADCPCQDGYVAEQGECVPTLLDLGSADFTLTPAFDSDVVAYAGHVSIFTDTLTLTASVPEGATIRINGASVVAGEAWMSPTLNLGTNQFEVDVLEGDTIESSYQVNVTRGEPVAYLKASNLGADDNFGSAIALSADGNTLAVGAFGESSAATGINGEQGDDEALESGAVYVFSREFNGWEQQAYIKASNTGAGDWFGSVLALSADGSTLAVGASHEDGASRGIGGAQDNDDAPNAGATYVFVRTSGSWTQQAYVKASNADEDDRFGAAVALSEDGSTMTVGAPGEDSKSEGVGGAQLDEEGTDSGAAYVFVRQSGIWTQQAYLKPSGSGQGRDFGGSLSLTFDGNSVAVGAKGDGVYVLNRTGSTWSHDAYLRPSTVTDGDGFGQSVAFSGNGATIVVGAPFENSSATGVNSSVHDALAAYSGAAHVFTRSGSTWSYDAYVKSSNAEEWDLLGESVSVSENGDLFVVGARNEDGSALSLGGAQDENALGAGAAYVFERVAGAWSERNYVKASNAATGDFFGAQVALSADGTTLAVSATEEASSDGSPNDNAAPGSGAAYIYR
ncbi:MAG TPA: cadherin-like beta sandwich domain-containing protein [Polyangiaceae bacterium]|nr:cadherin-like beta sandwich domain-containing protein [Polyangiaceae bacterium]